MASEALRSQAYSEGNCRTDGLYVQTVTKHMESLRNGDVILEINGVETVDWGELEKRKPEWENITNILEGIP